MKCIADRMFFEKKNGTALGVIKGFWGVQLADLGGSPLDLVTILPLLLLVWMGCILLRSPLFSSPVHPI